MAGKRFLALFFILNCCLYAFADEQTYTDKRYNFSITYPSGCRILKNMGSAAINIILPKTKFFDFYPGSITVAVTKAPKSTQPAQELLDIYFKYSKSVLEKKNTDINNIKFLSVIQTHKKYFLQFKLYHLITIDGSRMYTITYVALSGNFETNMEKAKQIMHSFKFIE